ncbi:MAG: hypothetical protein J0L57_16490 [Burkholderiales bacterium]|nr:hypothetical protein [Burkholderiales bacterium]
MLKAIFGFVGVLLVLAIVGSLGKKQLQAISQMETSTRVPSATASDGGSGGDPVAGKAVGGARLDAFGATAGADMPSAQAQIQGVQQSVRDRTADALQQGMQRNQHAQP